MATRIIKPLSSKWKNSFRTISTGNKIVDKFFHRYFVNGIYEEIKAIELGYPFKQPEDNLETKLFGIPPLAPHGESNEAKLEREELDRMQYDAEQGLDWLNYLAVSMNFHMVSNFISTFSKYDN